MTEIKMACPDCGSTKFAIPEESSVDDNICRCAECGKDIGTMEDVRQALREKARAVVRSAFKK